MSGKDDNHGDHIPIEQFDFFGIELIQQSYASPHRSLLYNLQDVARLVSDCWAKAEAPRTLRFEAFA